MKFLKYFFCFVILMPFFSVYAKDNFEVSKIIEESPIKAYRYKLKNGMQLIVIPDRRNSAEYVHFILDAGSDREHPGNTGLAHFFEHMMFLKAKGTEAGDYDSVTYALGATANAQTNYSAVEYFSTFPSPALETILKLEAKRFMDLDLSDPYFTNQKQDIISERKIYVENNPFQQAQEYLNAYTQRGTPLAWDVIGSKEDVQNMKLEKIKEFYKDFYNPDNVLLVVGGPIEHEKVYQLVRKYFESWEGKTTISHQAFPKDYFQRDLGKEFVCGADIKTQDYQMIYPSPRRSFQDNAYLLIFEAMLNQHPDGSFARRLAAKDFATDFDLYQNTWQKGSSPYIASFKLSKTMEFKKTKSFWLQNVQRVMKTPLTDQIKKSILKQIRLSHSQTAQLMTSLVHEMVENEYVYQDFYGAGKMESFVKNSTEAGFKKWLKEIFNGENFYLTGVVPLSMAEECSVARFLKKQ